MSNLRPLVHETNTLLENWRRNLPYREMTKY